MEKIDRLNLDFLDKGVLLVVIKEEDGSTKTSTILVDDSKSEILVEGVKTNKQDFVKWVTTLSLYKSNLNLYITLHPLMEYYGALFKAEFVCK